MKVRVYLFIVIINKWGGDKSASSVLTCNDVNITYR